MKPVQWRQAIPAADQVARKVEQEVQKQVGDLVIQMADKWMGENKLIHAGAAQRLADRLKESFKRDSLQAILDYSGFTEDERNKFLKRREQNMNRKLAKA